MYHLPKAWVISLKCLSYFQNLELFCFQNPWVIFKGVKKILQFNCFLLLSRWFEMVGPSWPLFPLVAIGLFRPYPPPLLEDYVASWLASKSGHAPKFLLIERKGLQFPTWRWVLNPWNTVDDWITFSLFGGQKTSWPVCHIVGCNLKVSDQVILFLWSIAAVCHKIFSQLKKTATFSNNIFDNLWRFP